jgi:hypothetical protein
LRLNTDIDRKFGKQYNNKSVLSGEEERIINETGRIDKRTENNRN